MSFREILHFALRGLRRQLVRTILTVIGVALGACTLAFSVGLGLGLRAFVDREFKSRPGFWEIHVNPAKVPTVGTDSEIPPQAVEVKGKFGDERNARIRRQLVQRYWQSHLPKSPAALTDASIAKMRALPEVNDVIAARWGQGHCYWKSKSAFVNVVAGRCDQKMFLDRVVAGRAPKADAAECAVSEMLLYDLGVTDEAGMTAALGSTIEVELGGRRDQFESLANTLTLTEDERKTLKEMLSKAPKEPVGEPAKGLFTIVGIVRAPVATDETERSSYSFRWMTFFTEGPEAEKMFRGLPHLADGHYDHAEVKVTPGGDLPGTVDAIEAMGFDTTSLAEWYANAKREVTLIGAGLNVFAILALLVASLGITNTLVTSVVERTREIGILKAIGATRNQLRVLFLIEGTLIGVAGGVLGLVAARLLAGPADEFVRQQVQTMMRGQTMLSVKVFEFPIWINILTPLFTAIVTTLAALYPAHRAATIPPVEALRHS